MTIVNHEAYVSLEVAKLLKEAGFDWECDYHYADNNTLCHGFCNNDPMFKIIISAPTLDVTQRWLREVKGIEVYAHVFYDTYDTSEGWDVYVYEVNHIIKQIEDWINSYDVYHSYEEAQEAGIKKVLEIILEKGE